MGREDPQLKLRLSEDLKAKVTDAARDNGRSVNAEIVARIEEYPKLSALRPRVMYLEHQNTTLTKRVSDLERHNEFLTEVISKAARDGAETEQNISFADALVAMRDELADMSRERGDQKSITESMLAEQQELIKELLQGQKETGSLLMAFRRAFLDAASGDRTGLDKLTEIFGQDKGD